MSSRWSARHAWVLGVCLGLPSACACREAERPGLTRPSAQPQGPVSGTQAPSDARPKQGSEGTRAGGTVNSLDVTLEVQGGRDGLALSVRNTGAQKLALASAITLEDSQGQSVLEPRALELGLKPGDTSCVSLAPGAELVAPAWFGAAPQTATDGTHAKPALLMPKAAGVYRLRVRSCDGAATSSVEAAWPAR
jgi:hypothetical protein